MRRKAPGFVLVLLALVALAGACAQAQAVDPGPAAAVKDKEGAYLAGPPVGLGQPVVVNRRDFIYALAFGRAETLAFVHHVTTNMELTVTQFEPLRPRFQQPINPTEFDVEDVVLVDRGPAAGTAAVPSRQGIARSFDATSGAVKRELITGVPLIRAALSPDGAVLAFGSGDGRVLLVDPGSFTVRGQQRLHDGEVHGLAFLGDGRLLSTAFDGTLKVSSIVPGGEPVAHAAATTLKTGERLFLAHLDGTRAIATVRDTRQPSNVITTAAVKRLGLAPASDGAALPVNTPAGASEGAAIELGAVHVHTLDLGAMRAAVCDACVPPGAELVLGAPALARAVIVDDVAHDEIVVRPAEGAPDAAKLIPDAVTLREEKSISLPGPGTDVDVSRRNDVLVSFSAEKAVRSLELYEREKKGEYPAPSPKSAAAIVDVNTGALGRSFVGHKGFTTTAAISPDGRTVVTGGWDKRVLVFDAQTGEQVTERELGWLVRRVRFSPDGHLLGVAAWTPVNALNEGDSDPSMLLYPVAIREAKVVAP
jgi:WD40 repeat protein